MFNLAQINNTVFFLYAFPLSANAFAFRSGRNGAFMRLPIKSVKSITFRTAAFLIKNE
jgi:hypothetical protein